MAAGFNRMLERIPAIESGLKQSEAHYRTLFDASPDGLRVICDDRVVMINPAGLKLFGLASAEDIIGKLVYEHIHPDFREAARDRVRHVIEGRQIAAPMEQVLTRSNGSGVDVEVVSVPFEYQGRPAAVSIVHDLTARKAVERAVRRLNAELEERVHRRTAELQRVNQELEAFSYTVAHDLRAPLRGINGFAGLLRQDHAGRLDDEGRMFIERIAAASENMDDLINGLLALSRLGRTELVLAEVDLSALAAAVAGQLAERDPARSVEFAIQPGLVAHADRRLIQDVLENLMGNAWKFTSGHARARIEFGAGAAAQDGERAYYVRATTAPASIQGTRPSCSAVFSACTAATSFRAPGSAWLRCGESSRTMAAVSGPRVRSNRARCSTSPCRQEPRQKAWRTPHNTAIAPPGQCRAARNPLRYNQRGQERAGHRRAAVQEFDHHRC